MSLPTGLRLLRVAVVGALLTAVGVTGPQAAGAAPPDIEFAAAKAYATGERGTASLDGNGTAIADLDDDGHDDIVLIAKWQGSTVTVLYGRGDGTFSAAQSIRAGAFNSNVITGDFDGDGRVDVAVTGAYSFVVVHNDGNRQYSIGERYTLAQSPFQNSGIAADLDGDDIVDLALKTPSGIRAMLGDGDGTFRFGPMSTIPFSFPGGIASIDDADLDGDGIVDLVAGDAGAQKVSSLRGGGDGSFTVVSQQTVPFLPTTVLAGDVDHRGVDSVVVLPEASPPGFTAAVLINAGDGTLGPPTYFDAGLANPIGEIADLNSDGHLDIISTNTFSGDQVLLAGNGDGTFVDAGTVETNWNAQTPGVGDFDGDGRLDLAVPAACPGPAGAFGYVCVMVSLNRS